MIKYTNCEIPAKLFFEDLLSKNNLSVLGNAPNSELEAVKMDIIDEYCDIDNNQRMKQWYKNQAKILLINQSISNITSLLYLLKYSNPNKKQQNQIINSLNTIKKPRVKFDATKPIDEEIIRVNTKVLGALRNELKILEPKDKKEEDKYYFDEDYMGLWTALGQSLPENPTLTQYVALKKEAKRRAKLNTTKNGK